MQFDRTFRMGYSGLHACNTLAWRNTRMSENEGLGAKAIVSKKAHAAWKGRSIVRVAEYRGEINLGGVTLGCAVLDDGMRVISERSVSEALQHDRTGTDYKRKRRDQAASGTSLPVFVSQAVMPFLSKEAQAKLTVPIRYQVIKGFGIPAIGVDSTLLADVCDAYILAFDAGLLPLEEHGKAHAAKVLMRALARVALAALIDEATGFQIAREKDELQKLLAVYVAEEHRPWIKKFPDEFWIQLFRLRNVKTDDIRKRPKYFGKLTNDVVYRRLVPGLLPKLDTLNPRSEMGRRARAHHQFLADEGEKHFATHMAGLVYLMKSSSNWPEFIVALNRAAPIQDDVLDAPENES